MSTRGSGVPPDRETEGECESQVVLLLSFLEGAVRTLKIRGCAPTVALSALGTLGMPPRGAFALMKSVGRHPGRAGCARDTWQRLVPPLKSAGRTPGRASCARDTWLSALCRWQGNVPA
jgi:hypothetical protein